MRRKNVYNVLELILRKEERRWFLKMNRVENWNLIIQNAT